MAERKDTRATVEKIVESLKSGTAARGEHRRFRAREPRLEKQWEIPVTFTDHARAAWNEMMRGELYADGMQLCMRDDGGYVVVPFTPLLPIQLNRVLEFLRDHPGIASVGEPIPFDVSHIRPPW